METGSIETDSDCETSMSWAKFISDAVSILDSCISILDVFSFFLFSTSLFRSISFSSFLSSISLFRSISFSSFLSSTSLSSSNSFSNCSNSSIAFSLLILISFSYILSNNTSIFIIRDLLLIIS